MHRDDVVLTLTRRDLRWVALIVAIVAAFILTPRLNAQKVQDEYKDKFKISTEQGGVGIATSSDGKYVYVAGKAGLIVSDDYGKTGTWVQTIQMK